ncbi:Glycosyl transferase family 2 [Methylobacillus rhizosphaerae]|uniref:Glycosyl transferase family 2 n=1 Tax=Methylobacillus rhizosphaerae TaxID=551994 RepID=A0A238XND2_9PROT|nr:glycosyltransferase family 2 protein [Methylobacillus rhizosphaerae]SNR59499.1 Glycosyl transferase family 2 [Methylobacillus rhizosphaerae]
MSLKKGNELSRQGLYEEAILEYKKVAPDSPLYDHAQFNIKHIESFSHIKTNVESHIAESKPSSIRQPLLSIVMPVFNVAPYLDTSIVSAISQHYQNFELIIINDASTDNGKSIIEMHLSQDSRIRFINLDHNTLGGAGIPSNIGIRAARGEYIAFIDSDDWVLPHAFANLMEQAVTHDVDVAIGSFCTFKEDERIVSTAYDSVAWTAVPKGKVISLKECPDLLRLSPVPWRKIYKRDFLLQNKIEYPEGDYFYEDNPLHWFVISKANRIIVTEDTVSYHRLAREGQTMSSASYKLSAICCHLNTILNYISPIKGEQRKTAFTEFYDYCYRSDWITQRQTQPAAQNMIKKRWAQIIEKAEKEFPLTTNRAPFPKRIKEYSEAYPDLDLTVVMPVYNSADLLRDSLDSILSIKGLKFNIIATDDGSTDESLSILQEYENKHSNIHIFTQGNRGAGRARNAVIPLCSGNYTFFMDADDVINSEHLVKAVKDAKKHNNDLYFFKYRIEFFEEKKSRDMFNADEKLWSQLPKMKTNEERQKVLAQLINYPWNRIIKTDLLHDANIFFGSTVVHNDIPYHWHSIVAAKNIGYCDDFVTTHRKFSERSQITNVSDARRMAVLEALRYTYELMTHYPQQSEDLLDSWKTFATDLLKWAKDRIPAELQETYHTKSQEILSSLNKV